MARYAGETRRAHKEIVIKVLFYVLPVIVQVPAREAKINEPDLVEVPLRVHEYVVGL